MQILRNVNDLNQFFLESDYIGYGNSAWNFQIEFTNTSNYKKKKQSIDKRTPSMGIPYL